MTEPLPRLREALADRYRLERELGAGGMATVYLAEDLKHRRKVAIKVLKPELAAVIGAERFLREIQTIATLHHPHILGLGHRNPGSRGRPVVPLPRRLWRDSLGRAVVPERPGSGPASAGP